HIMPQAWFRNWWHWSDATDRPLLSEQSPGEVACDHHQLGHFTLSFEDADRLVFCDNDTNFPRVFGVAGPTGYFKDGFDDFIVHDRQEAVNPAGQGTKVAAVYHRVVPASGTVVVRVRLYLGAGERPVLANF